MTLIDFLAQGILLLLGAFFAFSTVGLFAAGLLNPRVGTWSQYAWSACTAVAAYYLLTIAFTQFPIGA